MLANEGFVHQKFKRARFVALVSLCGLLALSFRYCKPSDRRKGAVCAVAKFTLSGIIIPPTEFFSEVAIGELNPT